MKKAKKKFRLNIVIAYYGGANLNNYRPPLIEMIKHLAWLYELEYAISIEHLFPFEADSSELLQSNNIADLIYLRSTEKSQIEAKDLRKIIGDTFGKSSLFHYGIEVCCQLYKALPEYPFPKEYIRPLNFPYVEYHNEEKVSVCIPDSNYFEFLADQSTFHEN